MNKSFFYGVALAVALGSVITPSIAMAQDTASAEQPAPSVADLQTAIASETPDLELIKSIVSTLMVQDSNNLGAIQSVAANASPEVQAAINAALGATGSIDSSAPVTSTATTANGGAIGGGGASGVADNFNTALDQATIDAQKAAEKAQKALTETQEAAEDAQKAAEKAQKALTETQEAAEDAQNSNNQQADDNDTQQASNEAVSPN